MTARHPSSPPDTWFDQGYRDGTTFAREEADYDELAAIHRAGQIPAGWDIFRARILQRHLGRRGFHFAAYSAGFARACSEFYEAI